MNLKAVLAGAVSAFALSSAASAAIVVTTYEGTVDLGTDHAGLLKAPGTSLAGLSWSAVLTIDTDINRETPGPGGEDDVVWGPDIFGGTENPYLSAVFTVDGSSMNLPIGDNVWAYVVGGEHVDHSSSVFETYYAWNFRMFSNDIPNRLTTEFDLGPSGPYAGAESFVYFYNDTTGYDFEASLSTARAYSVVQGVGGIPEPATWALMIGGFGLAGTMLRRRRLVPN